MANKESDLVTVWINDKINEKNINFLRSPVKPVTFPISKQIQKIIDDLIDTFKAIPCAGIAANQIGYDKKIFIGMKYDKDLSVSEDSTQNIDEVKPDPENYEIYINPQIDRVDRKSTQIGTEGCLSIPEIVLNIERYDNIKVRYYNAKGRAIKKPLKGFISRLFQHELDHLEGRLMFEEPLSNVSIDEDTKKEHIYKIQALIKYLNS